MSELAKEPQNRVEANMEGVMELFANLRFIK